MNAVAYLVSPMLLGVCLGCSRAADASPSAVTPPPPTPLLAATHPPPMGWTSWSRLRTSISDRLVEAQADALVAQLAPYGYDHVNIDDGWYLGCDEHGRLKPDPEKFPGGISAVADYVHGKGLKLGIYLTPGVLKTCDLKGLVVGTRLHVSDIVDTTRPGNVEASTYHIDFSRDGATEHVRGYAELLASWGVDYVKMDFVGPDQGHMDVDDRDEIEAWWAALGNQDRPMWLELSNSLSFKLADFWKAHSNGWRIEGDVEFARGGGLTTWFKILDRFADAPKWAPYAGPGGWNDLDSLEIGNGAADGLSVEERRTTMTLWAISCAPLILGADLTALDEADLALLTNEEVLAIDQAGHVATPLRVGGQHQIWRAKNPDGSLTVALFNLGDEAGEVSVKWSELDVSGSPSVRDSWLREELGRLDGGYSALIPPHGARLLRVTP